MGVTGDQPIAGDRRARFLRALAREPVDRPPVICTGGSMTAVPAEVVAGSGFALPAAHLDPAAMAGLALAAARITGFESVGIPLCTTVEAEVFDAEIDLGDAVTEARLVREPYRTTRDVPLIPVEDRLRRGRIGVAIEAVRQLAGMSGDLPIIANLIGPVSIAASAVEPETFFRELRTKRDETKRLVEHVTAFLAAYSRALIAAGADAIAIHEDTGTPSLIGPLLFEQVTLPALELLIAEIHEAGAPVLLHMCGNLGRAETLLSRLHCEGFIPDAVIPPGDLGRSHPHLAIIGNLGTFLLHQGAPEQITRSTSRLVRDRSVHIVSPACGMASATPLANIRALTDAVIHPVSAALEEAPSK